MADQGNGESGTSKPSIQVQGLLNADIFNIPSHHVVLNKGAWTVLHHPGTVYCLHMMQANRLAFHFAQDQHKNMIVNFLYHHIIMNGGAFVDLSVSPTTTSMSSQGTMLALRQALRGNAPSLKCSPENLSMSAIRLPLGMRDFVVLYLVPWGAGRISCAIHTIDPARDASQAHHVAPKEKGCPTTHKVSSSGTKQATADKAMPQVLFDFVVFGRGGMVNSHPANVRFRNLVRLNREVYASCPKHTKIQIARTIYRHIINNGGGFLKRDYEGGIWTRVEYKECIRKCSQALREKTYGKTEYSLDEDVVQMEWIRLVSDDDNSPIVGVQLIPWQFDSTMGTNRKQAMKIPISDVEPKSGPHSKCNLDSVESRAVGAQNIPILPRPNRKRAKPIQDRPAATHPESNRKVPLKPGDATAANVLLAQPQKQSSTVSAIDTPDSKRRKVDLAEPSYHKETSLVEPNLARQVNERPERPPSLSGDSAPASLVSDGATANRTSLLHLPLTNLAHAAWNTLSVASGWIMARSSRDGEERSPGSLPEDPASKNFSDCAEDRSCGDAEMRCPPSRPIDVANNNLSDCAKDPSCQDGEVSCPPSLQVDNTDPPNLPVDVTDNKSSAWIKDRSYRDVRWCCPQSLPVDVADHDYCELRALTSKTTANAAQPKGGSRMGKMH